MYHFLPLYGQTLTNYLIYSYIPVGIYIQEAEDLNHWFQPDREKLIAAGIPEEVLDDLSIRAGAARYAQAEWMEELNTREEAEQEWEDKSPAVYDLRDGLIHGYRYAYRKSPDILERVSFISEGYGHADMIQDLENLAAVGRNNPAPLKAIGFDMEQLNLAAKMSDDMADLLGQANGDKGSDNFTMMIRDKAYTHLKEAVDEIRECGKYLFWRNPDRLKGYTSAYLRRMNKKKGKSEEAPEVT